MKGLSPFGFPLGISTTFWLLVGLFRLIYENLEKWMDLLFYKKLTDLNNPKYKKTDLAVILPAHNEEVVIRRTVQYLKKSLDPKQIYVVSDGSVDKTTYLATDEGCNVLSTKKGLGKANALIKLVETYRLYDRFKLIFIVDADTRIHKDFVKRALVFFDDPKVAVVFGGAVIVWPQHIIPQFKYYLIAYRERLNRFLQYFLIYGMTFRYTNSNFVTPGFATIYRSEVLRQLDLNKPGLLIEDFNLAFDLHKKKLGVAAYSPGLIAYDQHPDNLPDYWKQVRRWNIGFYQTVKAQFIWPSLFWVSLITFSVEVTLNSIFTLFLPVVFLYLLAPLFPQVGFLQQFHTIYLHFGPYHEVTLRQLLIYMFVFDYGMTVLIGLINKKPQFIFYGLFFFVMHYITSLIMIFSIIPGFFGSSNGRWISPKRRNEK